MVLWLRDVQSNAGSNTYFGSQVTNAKSKKRKNHENFLKSNGCMMETTELLLVIPEIPACSFTSLISPVSDSA